MRVVAGSGGRQESVAYTVEMLEMGFMVPSFTSEMKQFKNKKNKINKIN